MAIINVQPPIDLVGASVDLKLEHNGAMTSIGVIAGMDSNVNFVESIKVKLQLLQVTTIEVSLAPPIDQALTLLRSGSLGLGFSKKKPSQSSTAASSTAQSPGGISVYMNKMSVQLNYGGLTSPIFKALLLQPDVSVNAEGISIVLHGIGMLFEASKTYPNVSYTGKENTIDIVTDLIGDQVNLQFDPQAKSVLSAPYGKAINENGKNNLEIVKEILDENHCAFALEGAKKPNQKETMKVFTINERRQKSPKVTFSAFTQIDPTNKNFPILSFECPVQNLLLPFGAWGSVKTGGFNSDLKKSSDPTVVGANTYSERSGNIVSADGTVGGGASQAQKSQTGEAGGIARHDQTARLIPVPFRNKLNSLESNVKGAVYSFIDKVFEYNLSSVAVVDQLPGRLVYVNIGNIPELTGNFDLIEIEHVFSHGGAESHMTLQRTGGLVSAVSENLEKVKSKAVDATTGNTISSTTLGVQS